VLLADGALPAETALAHFGILLGADQHEQDELQEEGGR